MVLTDNSESMLNYLDSSEVKSSVPGLMEQLKGEFGDRFEYQSLILSENQADTFSAKETNLSDLLNRAYEIGYAQNIGGVVLVSDGRFNTGASPLYAAEKFSLTPFFTVGVGDTIAKRDHFIKDLTVNEYAFLNNEFPVEVAVEAQAILNEQVTLALYKEGKLLSSQKVEYDNAGLHFKSVEFSIEAKQEGLNRYDLVLSDLSNESNYQNNKRSFYVEVLKSRKKVLLLAAAPHPDVAALSSVLETEQNVELTRTLVKDWTGNLSEYDLVVFHEPGKRSFQALHKEIESLGIPIWYFIGPRSDLSVVNAWSIGFEGQRTGQTDDLEAQFNTDFLSFDLSEETQKAIQTWPPLKSQFGDLRVKNGAEVLLNQRIGPVVKSAPLFFFTKKGKRDIGITYGTGIWRWKMADFANAGNADQFRELVQNTVQLLTVEKDKSPFKVVLPERINQMQDFIVKATLYNESMQAINEPEVLFELTDEKGAKRRFNFGKTEKGYVLNAGNLTPGVYEWRATTQYNGKDFIKSGVYLVKDLQLEKLSNHANHGLLRQIASKTNGAFFKLSDFNALKQTIASRNDLSTVVREEKNYQSLIDLKWLFGLLAIALIGEWFCRRFWGGY